MALKPDNKIVVDDINFRCASVSEKGFLVTFNTSTGLVEKLTSSPSGKKVAGMLLMDVVTRGMPENAVVLGEDTGTMDQPLPNRNRLETHVSGVVRLAKLGELYTNAINPTDWANIVVGDKLYVTASGKLSRTKVSSGHELVATALSVVDTDHYLKIYLNIA